MKINSPLYSSGVSRLKKKNPAMYINLAIQGVKLDTPTKTCPFIRYQQNDPRTPTTSALSPRRLFCLCTLDSNLQLNHHRLWGFTNNPNLKDRNMIRDTMLTNCNWVSIRLQWSVKLYTNRK